MKIQVEDLARQQLIDIYYYNYRISLQNAIRTNKDIQQKIHNIENTPFVGRAIPELSDERFREIIFKKSRHSVYRIMYFISDKNNIIYVFNIINSKQNFKNILKLHSYFNNYFNF